ncbi:hypothetical protein HYX02_03460 [Candidatus Woesearchaeota archaeon]|nr:hypothetical protein [Candidatus Woesearchaeota archaeon]
MTEKLGSSLIVLGAGGVGSSVLEQIIAGSHNFMRSLGGIVVVDSGHLVLIPYDSNLGAVNEEHLKLVLEAKRKVVDGKRGSLGSLRDRLDIREIGELWDYINKEDLAINTLPTEFSNSESGKKTQDALTARIREPSPFLLANHIPISVLYNILAMQEGAHVVDASKSAFGKREYYQAINMVASSNCVDYDPNGAIMGPTSAFAVLRWLTEHSIGIKSVRAILNGATNYILGRAKEISVEGALREAQIRKIAESDPTADIEGYDPAQKLRVIGNSLDLDVHPKVSGIDDKHRGIDGVTNEYLQKIRDNGKLKLICTLDTTTREAIVRPEIVSPDDPLYDVDGTQNAIVLTLDQKLRLIEPGNLDIIRKKDTTKPEPDILKMLLSIYRHTTTISANGTSTVRVTYPSLSEGHRVYNHYKIQFVYDPRRNQLIIKGPGAGAAETAAALLDAAYATLERRGALVVPARKLITL